VIEHACAERDVRLIRAGRRLDQPFRSQTEVRASKVCGMSLAEIEKQVLELTEEERRQFAAWFYQNEGKILPPPLDEDEGDGGEISEAMKAELLLRKQEYFDHPERFRRVKNKAELKAYFDEIRDEARNRLPSAR
jgi:hypothetical protein